MEDKEIINLLLNRSEIGLKELKEKYSNLYGGIIRNMLEDKRDAQEVEDDLLMAVWNSIPPNNPNSLIAYVCSIAKRLTINKFKYNNRQKRSAEYEVLLSELGDCISDDNTVESVEIEDLQKIREELNRFIAKLDKFSRYLFVRRYIFNESILSLSKKFGVRENSISVKLYRIRKRLSKRLKKVGVKI